MVTASRHLGCSQNKQKFQTNTEASAAELRHSIRQQQHKRTHTHIHIPSPTRYHRARPPDFKLSTGEFLLSLNFPREPDACHGTHTIRLHPRSEAHLSPGVSSIDCSKGVPPCHSRAQSKSKSSPAPAGCPPSCQRPSQQRRAVTRPAKRSALRSCCYSSWRKYWFTIVYRFSKSQRNGTLSHRALAT